MIYRHTCGGRFHCICSLRIHISSVACSLVVFLAFCPSVLGFSTTSTSLIPDRRLVELSLSGSIVEYKLIETPGAFLDVCKHLEGAEALGVDFECEYNRHRYGMHLCLIQVSDGNNIYVIDPLTLPLQPLWDILQDPEIPIILHGPGSDLMLLDCLYGCRPRNMFDTEKAAQLLGYPSSSLSYLLEKHFNRKKEKKLTASNWNIRPLSSEMLDYAALDVACLHELRDILTAKLQLKGRLSWQEEECLLLEEVRYREKENQHLRIKGAEALNDQEARVLKHLFEVRNALAQELDKPPYHVIVNPLMLKLARRPPASQAAWANLKGVHPRVRKNAQRFHRAVVNSQDTATDPSPTPITPDYMGMSEGSYNELVYRRKIEILDIICKQIQQEYDDIAGLVFTPRIMRRIATGEASLDGLRRWQRAIVDQKGKELDLDMTLFL